MWSLGFGLERIGLAALRYPKSATLLLVCLCVFSLKFIVSGLGFDGNVTAVLPEDSRAYHEFFEQKRDYRDSSKDVTLIVRSPRLMSAQGLEDLRSLQLEIAILDGVDNAVSLFAVPSPDPQTGELNPFFPELIESDSQAKVLVEKLLAERPQAKALVVPDENLAVMRITLEGSDGSATDAEAYVHYQDMRAEINELKPDDFEVLYTGITPLGLTIVEALISDQVKLTLIGLILGTGIAYYVFRSWLGALICAIPPAMAAMWTLGLFAVTGNPLNYLTTVLPTIGLILAFADGIVLYYRWQTSNSQNSDFLANLRTAIIRVGPASALTSVTTAIAFASFWFASSQALKSFAILGVGAVTAAFLAVIIALPVASYWAIKAGALKAGKVRKPVFGKLGERMYRVVHPAPVLLSVGAILLVGVLGFVHTQVRAEYRITDYLPFNSDTRKAEDLANNSLLGGSSLFVSIPLTNKNSLTAPENLEKLAAVEAIFAKTFGVDKVVSINNIFAGLETQAAIEHVASELIAAEPSSRSTYLSGDTNAMLLTAFLSSKQSVVTTNEQLSTVRSDLEKAGFNGVKIAGLPVLMAEEFTVLIEQLRTSLLIAIALGVFIVGVATRSPLMAIAAITPNLLPILAVEFVIYLMGGAVNLSQVIALTIAFGIAIDNAVHVINVLDEARRQGLGVRDGIRSAMVEIGPALGASTMIICVATIVTLLSSMPMVPILGQLMIATLIVALLSNLAILPANVLSMRKMLPGLFGRRNQG